MTTTTDAIRTAIDTSIREGCIVRLAYDRALADELRGVCDFHAEDRYDGVPELEFRGVSADGDDWRIHLAGAPIRCESGQWSGEACQGDDPADQTVEIVDEQHRGTCDALHGQTEGLTTTYRVCAVCAEHMMDWTPEKYGVRSTLDGSWGALYEEWRAER